MVTKEKIKNIMQMTHFELDVEENNSLQFRTREHGNVGDEEPGQEDIDRALQLKKQILTLNLRNLDSVSIETIHEWVDITFYLKEDEV